MPVTKDVTLRPWLGRLFSCSSADELKGELIQSFAGRATQWPAKVFVVGASSIGKGIIDSFLKIGVCVGGLFDDDLNKQGTAVKGIRVQSIDELQGKDELVPVVLATQKLLGLQKRIERMGFQCVWPFPVLPVMDPVKFPAHPFYEGLIEDLFHNREQLFDLSLTLGDEASRAVLDAVIGFRLTLNAKGLEDFITDDAYLSRDILRFSDREVFVDGGAFDGDSIRSFIRICSGKFSKIISFEPSRHPFERLSQTFGDDNRIRLVQAFLYDRETTLAFENAGQRDSSAAENGPGERVAATSIDRLPESGEVSFIKMNIEGAEYRALLGAQETIRRQRPKLAVAVYHRASDLWKLPRLIKELNPDYKLFLRQHDGGIIETVLYAIE